jgi:beta-xylosidase
MKFFKISILIAFSILYLNVEAQQNDEAYLFSYFMGNGEDGLHLAYSYDGLKWKALNDNKSFLAPEVGGDKLMRDPCIIVGPMGKYHMVWTVSWKDKGIGYASSNDLIHWSEQKYLSVMHHEPDARNCWAPELFYDDDSKQYLICWATTIPGKVPATDSLGDDGYNHRIYYTTTKDFIKFSDTKIMYDKDFNVIDATIVKDGKSYVMFLKNETLLPKAEKNIRIATSNNLLGNYTQASEPISTNWVEGPTAIKINDEWIIYFDMYTKGKMGAAISSDLINWTDISDKINFPEGTRHGTIFKVKQSVLNDIVSLHNKR